MSQGIVIVEVTLWDDDKADAVVAMIERDPRVLSAERIDQ